VQTPLHYASRNGKADVVETLLQNGAMINKTDVISFPFNEGVMQRETSKEIPD
jgi:ankyrin repeat protein